VLLHVSRQLCAWLIFNVGRKTMTKTKRKCFVLMPFADALREIYDQVFKPVCSDNDIECWRVDEIAKPGSITRDIVNGIIEADLVIADLTNRNPNVFYELGIAHSVGNKTIMVSQHKTDVPFDIANYRVIFYEQTIAGSKAFIKSLDQAIKELLKSLEQTNNPVQEVISSRSFFKIKQKTPIVTTLNVSALPKAVRDFIGGENLIYTEDLAKADLEKMKVKYHMGKTSLELLVGAMLTKGIYDDVTALHNLALKYSLDTKPNWRTERI
jgi:hypothetical protein